MAPARRPVLLRRGRTERPIIGFLPRGRGVASAASGSRPRAMARRSRGDTSRARLASAAVRLLSGTRRRRPRGWIRKVIGVSSSNASPSTPAKAVPERERTSKVSAVNSCQWRLRRRWPRAEAATTAAASEPVAAVMATMPSVPLSRRRRWEASKVAPSDVRVVGHLDEEGAVDLGAVGLGELEVEGALGAAQQLGEQRLRRLDLGVAVSLLLHDRGVHAERHVVHEEPVSDGGEVDAPLQPVTERIEAEAGILAVDAEVEGEVVAGSGRDDDEGKVVLDRDRGDERLGAVAPRHAQAVGAPGDRVTGERLEVEAVVEHHHLDTHLLGEGNEAEPLDLASPGPRVADQDRVARPGDDRRPPTVALVQVGHERSPTGAHGADGEHRGEQEPEDRSVGRGRDRGDRHRDDRAPDERPDDSECPPGHLLGDDPPRPGDGDAEADHGADHVAEAADDEQQHHDREQHATTEGDESEHPAAPGTTRYERSVHVGPRSRLGVSLEGLHRRPRRSGSPHPSRVKRLRATSEEASIVGTSVAGRVTRLGWCGARHLLGTVPSTARGRVGMSRYEIVVEGTAGSLVTTAVEGFEVESLADGRDASRG